MRRAQTTCLVILASLLLLQAAPAAEPIDEPLSKIKQNLDEEKAVLVDVRARKEWDDGHIQGAIFLPVTSLQSGVTPDKLKPLPKDKILYIHCVVGKRAATAATILQRHGYRVRPMKPGYKEMIAAGFPKAKE